MRIDRYEIFSFQIDFFLKMHISCLKSSNPNSQQMSRLILEKTEGILEMMKSARMEKLPFFS